eukprot:1147354-Pelagomonas_calceolata.AAC.3
MVQRLHPPTSAVYIYRSPMQIGLALQDVFNFEDTKGLNAEGNAMLDKTAHPKQNCYWSTPTWLQVEGSKSQITEQKGYPQMLTSNSKHVYNSNEVEHLAINRALLQKLALASLMPQSAVRSSNTHRPFTLSESPPEPCNISETMNLSSPGP